MKINVIFSSILTSIWAPKSSEFSYEMLQFRWFQLRHPSKTRISQTSVFLISFDENHEKLHSRVGASPKMNFLTYRENLLFSSIQNARLSSRVGHSSIFVMFACVQKNNMLMLCFWKTAKTHGFFNTLGGQSPSKWQRKPSTAPPRGAFETQGPRIQDSGPQNSSWGIVSESKIMKINANSIKN